MTLTFYYGSGSPYAWKVWLALEHKQLPYELKLLSFSAGDLKKPDFLAVNPRGKVPALVHDGFALYESTAIVEYLDDVWPTHTIRPSDLRHRALARRMVEEANHYFYVPLRRVVAETLFKPNGGANLRALTEAKREVFGELERIERNLAALPGSEMSWVDYGYYAFFATAKRVAERMPEHREVFSRLGPQARASMARVEAKPFFEKTIPPHWKA